MFRSFALPGGLLACASLMACQGYRAAPLDPGAFQEQWRARRVDDPGVAAFAQRLGGMRSATPFDPSDGLSLQEAQAVALVFNPELRLSRRRAGVAAARAKHAGRWADPVLDIDAERIISGVQHPWVIAGTVGLTLPVSGRLEVEKKRASAEHAVELIKVAAAEGAVVQRLGETWAQWSAQGARIELLETLMKRLDGVVGLTDRLAAAGAITRSESRVFQIERATRQVELISTRLRLEELRLQLHALMGLTPEAPVKLSPDLRMPVIRDDGSTDVSRGFPVLVAQAEYETAERLLEREVRAQFPDITIGPGAGSDEGDTRLLLGLQLPIPLWNRNVQAVAEAWAARELAAEQFRAAVESHTYARRLARLQLEGAQRQRAFVEKTLAPAADEQAVEVQKLADLGDLDAMLLLDAIRRQYEVKLRVLEAWVEEIRAATRVVELQGQMPAGHSPAKHSENP